MTLLHLCGILVGDHYPLFIPFPVLKVSSVLDRWQNIIIYISNSPLNQFVFGLAKQIPPVLMFEWFRSPFDLLVTHYQCTIIILCRNGLFVLCILHLAIYTHGVCCVSIHCSLMCMPSRCIFRLNTCIGLYRLLERYSLCWLLVLWSASGCRKSLKHPGWLTAYSNP